MPFDYAALGCCAYRIGPQGPQGPPGPAATDTPVAVPNVSFARFYGSDALADREYRSGDVVCFDAVGELQGSAIRFSPTGGDITLAGGRAYYVAFEGAVETTRQISCSTLAMFLNGTHVAGSSAITTAHNECCQPCANSVTSVVVIATPSGGDSHLQVKFCNADCGRLIDPVINIFTIN